MKVPFMFRLFVAAALLCSAPAFADLECDVDLRFGIVVNEKQIRVLDESRTVYQINDADQLIVKGNWIELNEAQQKNLQDFAKGIHYVVPKMIILASEGVELAVETVEHVYVGLVGKDHKSYDKMQSSLQRVQKRIKERFIHASDNFYIGPGRLENVDELVDQELEEQIEQAINTSVGGVLSAIGGLASSNDEQTNAKMEDLSARIEIMGQEIERQVGPRADTLRQKAAWFCNKMHYLDKVEEQLRADVKELKPFDVIMTQDHIVH